MTAATVSAPSYGAMELKRAYQQNLLLGILIASTFHAAILMGIIAYKGLVTGEVVTGPIPTPPVVVDVKLAPPPSILVNPDLIRATRNVAPPTIGIPEAVADEEVVETVIIPTQTELAILAHSDISDVLAGALDAGDSIVVDGESEYFPELGQFVAFQEPPALIRAVSPVYPEIAQLTGREGSVVVFALVAKDGSVIETTIAKSSGMNVGFDEAALAAVSQYRFRPALQNGNPVAVWVSQRIDFALD